MSKQVLVRVAPDGLEQGEFGLQVDAAVDGWRVYYSERVIVAAR
jgi:hypothetical protein